MQGTMQAVAAIIGVAILANLARWHYREWQRRIFAARSGSAITRGVSTRCG
jgi:hypothetical protein